jgi:hypothetical protein
VTRMDEKTTRRALELAKWFQEKALLFPLKITVSMTADDTRLIAKALQALIKRDESVW